MVFALKKHGRVQSLGARSYASRGSWRKRGRESDTHRGVLRDGIHQSTKAVSTRFSSNKNDEPHPTEKSSSKKVPRYQPFECGETTGKKGCIACP